MVKQRNKHGFNGGETFSNLKNGKILLFQNGCRTAAGNCCIFHSTNHLKNCCMFQKLEISGLSWEFGSSESLARKFMSWRSGTHQWGANIIKKFEWLKMNAVVNFGIFSNFYFNNGGVEPTVRLIYNE